MKKPTILLFFFITLLFLLHLCYSLDDHHEETVSFAKRGKESRVEGFLKTDNGTEINAQRGKGSYGGANVVHKKPESAASTTDVSIALSLLLLLPYFTLNIA